MPKKINTEMIQLGAAEFGNLLQKGKLVRVRAGLATIELTRSVRGKSSTEVYHIHLQPCIVHHEVDAEAEVETKAEKKKPGRKPGRKPKAEQAEKPRKKPGRKPGRKTRAQLVEPEASTEPTEEPATKPRAKSADAESTDEQAEKPRKKPGRKPGRKTRAQSAPDATEASVDGAPAEDTPTAPAKPKAKKAAPAHIPWSDGDELGEEDFEI